AKRTPSHFAASLKDTSIYNLLVSCGADLDAEDAEGRKPDFYKENPQVLSKALDSCKTVEEETSQSRYELKYGDMEINKANDLIENCKKQHKKPEKSHKSQVSRHI
uniref:Uncharacterized protein n=1 Tax=Romanomermis culicivorax TaxID=13658 RepID=A0A915IUE1_ROMCU